MALGMSPYEALFGFPPPMGPLGIPRFDNQPKNFKDYFGIRRKELMGKEEDGPGTH